MKIKGEYRDVVKKNNEIIEDRGWKSNNISKDLGKLIAAMMRNKDFISPGITHMAVGSSRTAENNEKGADAFYTRVRDKVFQLSNNENPKIKDPIFYSNDSEWAWAKEIGNKITFLNDQGNQSLSITNRLQISVIFENNDPKLSGKTFEFKEFALLGTGTYNSEPEEMYFINYVAHDPISMTFQGSDDDNSTDLTRTVQLTFP